MEETATEPQSIENVMFLGNELWRFGALLIAIILGYAGGKIIGAVLNNYGKKQTEQDHVLIGSVLGAVGRSLGLLGLILGIGTGLNFLLLEPGVAEIVETVVAILMTIAVGMLIYRLVEVPKSWFERYADKSDNVMNKMLVPIVDRSLKVFVVLLVLVQVAQILSDKPITSIIAGLGIGGLAFALAAQDSLKHIFGSIVIFIDKPFQVGERIQVGGFDGIVEEVGLRSTRIRTLTGHLVTYPNGELANQAVENVARRPHIRRLTNITITYDTPPDKIERAVEIIRDILKDHEGMDPEYPPRAYFNEFNAASLNIIVLYWYHPPAYWDFLEYAQKFNMELVRRYNDEGIEFAFPTQTLYLAGDPNRPLELGIKDGREGNTSGGQLPG